MKINPYDPYYIGIKRFYKILKIKESQHAIYEIKIALVGRPVLMRASI
jgi:hypothetical protein